MIQFNYIEIIEFPVILGEQQQQHNDEQAKCNSKRVPLQLSWEPQSRTIVDMDEYEVSHPTRRTTRQLVLSKQQRINVLQRNGVTINACAATASRSRKLSRKQNSKLSKKILQQQDTTKKQLEDIMKKIEEANMQVEHIRQKINSLNNNNVNDNSSSSNASPKRTVIVARCA